ncbi:ROK family transcriptional regulator [Neokomagataea anthophila]|uniref:ROK family transcriptional regulator n=1 Tax=Neokomagataea anthophila TaxID=2826925 RepID=A0ABS5E9W6_9PROT|nr:ROK family transcriptional regulator [Neokomagataea anthophila]MBR0560707.1 ROK family transcriptional regulator [Neokomagataea anthophila]
MLSNGHHRVLSSLARGGPMSRSDLAARLTISKAGMTAIVRDLLERGWVEEKELIRRQGRPAVRLCLKANAASLIGVSLQSDPVRVVLTDLRGDVLRSVHLPRYLDVEVCCDALAEVVHQFCADMPEGAGPVMGIGVAQPGFVSRDRRICLASIVFGWKDVNVADPLSERTGLPVRLENDANVLALGELLFGEHAERTHFSLVCLADGVGSGHVMGGRLQHGAHGGAGEIAHSPLVLDAADALPCRCGNRGCLETISSLEAMQGAARMAGLPETIELLSDIAMKGDPGALKILHRGAGALGLALAQMVQMLDPEEVIVVLPASLRAGLFGIVLRQEMERHVLRRAGRQVALTLRDLYADAFAVGAASLAAYRFLHGCDPE